MQISNLDEHLQQATLKHCYSCNKCIHDYDHHCNWINNCIGKKSFHYFSLFITILLINSTYKFYLFLAYGLDFFENSNLSVDKLQNNNKLTNKSGVLNFNSKNSTNSDFNNISDAVNSYVNIKFCIFMKYFFTVILGFVSLISL